MSVKRAFCVEIMRDVHLKEMHTSDVKSVEVFHFYESLSICFVLLGGVWTSGLMDSTMINYKGVH